MILWPGNGASNIRLQRTAGSRCSPPAAEPERSAHVRSDHELTGAAVGPLGDLRTLGVGRGQHERRYENTVRSSGGRAP
jgi:hypothetical protein